MSSSPRHTNRLAKETSPYLLQHAHNPVDWYPWGEEAFRAAREQDKPILLSIGYSACHWCHVMERESFENEQVAAKMNAAFINIKVDREERPDVDQLYQGVVQLMRRGGGWPLTVFLTPELKPFFGGTYFPPIERYGMPSFTRLLDSLASAFRERRREVEESAEEFENGLAYLMSYGLDAAPSQLQESDVRAAAGKLAEDVDRVNGGFGSAPKFPNPMSLVLMLRGFRRGGGDALRDLTLLTLDRMAERGLYDHLGGGFHRYSVDARWAVPHFEKMLYDNAQLLHLYAEAHQLAPKPLYARVVEETAAYLAREMTSPEGGFYATQDADSEGVEGKFFVWTPAQVKEVLGEARGALLCAHLGIDEQGNFEHGQTVLHVAATPEQLAARDGRPVETIAGELEAAKRALFEAREKRVHPGRDDKILAGWNGMTIRALAHAARVFGRDDWLAMARRAADFVLDRMRVDGRLLRSFKDGEARIDGLLEDYGSVCEGLVGLYVASQEPRYLEAAAALADKALELFWDDGAKAFLSGPKDGERLLTKVFALHDNAWPSGASTLTNALVALAGLTSRQQYLDAAERYLTRMRE
ncbi:MAG: thioredoxin domain-containing protein, partial [Myxococcales bacterium]